MDQIAHLIEEALETRLNRGGRVYILIDAGASDALIKIAFVPSSPVSVRGTGATVEQAANDCRSRLAEGVP